MASQTDHFSLVDYSDYLINNQFSNLSKSFDIRIGGGWLDLISLVEISQILELAFDKPGVIVSIVCFRL